MAFEQRQIALWKVSTILGEWHTNGAIYSPSCEQLTWWTRLFWLLARWIYSFMCFTFACQSLQCILCCELFIVLWNQVNQEEWKLLKNLKFKLVLGFAALLVAGGIALQDTPSWFQLRQDTPAPSVTNQSHAQLLSELLISFSWSYFRKAHGFREDWGLGGLFTESNSPSQARSIARQWSSHLRSDLDAKESYCSLRANKPACCGRTICQRL